MSEKNPSLGLTNADVVRLRDAAEILPGIIPVWSQDGRYASQVGVIEDAATTIDEIARQVSDYLVVEGT